MANTESDLGKAAHVEGQWLAGWIALQFLDQPQIALDHFANMQSQVSMPISIARANYWAARAASKLANTQLPKAYHLQSAQHLTTFYGQLSNSIIQAPFSINQVAIDHNNLNIETFKQTTLVRATLMFAELGEADLLKTFVLHLIKNLNSQSEIEFLTRLGSLYSFPHITIAAAKLALRKGTLLPKALYPIPYPFIANFNSRPDLDRAVILAIARQESEMNPRAVSASGAHGFMQIMPSTARQTAQKLNLDYEKGRLTSDIEYNILLGSTYFQELLKRYQGSYVIALAAYNAGPKRVNRWLRKYGDPRIENLDEVDWIERLPYAETRNYIQRVLEGRVVYRYFLRNNVE